jgi:hypothetical protein
MSIDSILFKNKLVPLEILKRNSNIRYLKVKDTEGNFYLVKALSSLQKEEKNIKKDKYKSLLVPDFKLLDSDNKDYIYISQKIKFNFYPSHNLLKDNRTIISESNAAQIINDWIKNLKTESKKNKPISLATHPDILMGLQNELLAIILIDYDIHDNSNRVSEESYIQSHLKSIAILCSSLTRNGASNKFKDLIKYLSNCNGSNNDMNNTLDITGYYLKESYWPEFDNRGIFKKSFWSGIQNVFNNDIFTGKFTMKTIFVASGIFTIIAMFLIVKYLFKFQSEPSKLSIDYNEKLVYQNQNISIIKNSKNEFNIMDKNGIIVNSISYDSIVPFEYNGIVTNVSIYYKGNKCGLIRDDGLTSDEIFNVCYFLDEDKIYTEKINKYNKTIPSVKRISVYFK